MKHQQNGSAISSIVLVVLTTVTIIGMGVWIKGSFSTETPSALVLNDSPTAINYDSATPTKQLSSEKKHPVVVSKPLAGPRVDTGLKDSHGNSVTVACATCHTTRVSNHDNKLPVDLNEFHGGMAFLHGAVSCLSCHNPSDYDSLKLADGTRLEFSDVMTLCSQCHGTQRRDYDHGAHGGMNGYWDLSRGPRTRNNCVDCHDPHLPKFPHMQPTFKPHDRFLNSTRPNESKTGGHE